jgi:hypothetical protein
LLLLLGVLHAEAQFVPQSNWRSKKIVTAPVLRIDTLSIIPGSFQLQGLPDSAWRLNELNSTLIFFQSVGDTVLVQYRVFGTDFAKVRRRMSFDSIINNSASQAFIFNRQGVGKDDLLGGFDFGNIVYNGSFGRGLSFGNAQSAVVSSQLNLQINGFLLDSIEVAAAITDNNIPIQPDGTTQQLNEFDRILLQFKKKHWEVSLGDIDIRKNETYFFNFYKRLQGAGFFIENKLWNNTTNKLSAAGAIAKGKFTRNLLPSLEGNQGPYRLVGANNELFFIVLAGTERVFMDGELLQRGEDQDYVINYNTAEISFTPKRLINKDRRIQVEFEYADRNYLNSLFFVSDELKMGDNVKLMLNVYSLSDAKNSPINQSLNTQQRQFLNALGDSIDQAFFPTVFLDTAFSSSKILYAQRDSFVNGQLQTIYVYSNNRDSAKYSLNFSDLGFGNGDYVELYNGANGKVYQYVAPDFLNRRQGRFMPVSKLITPKSQQLYNAALDVRLGKNTKLQTEFAISSWDVNTFSTKQKSNDEGYAAKALFTQQSPLRLFKKQLNVEAQLGYEYIGNNFKPIERLRAVEFSRDWNLPLQAIPEQQTEQIPTAQVKINDVAGNSVQYQFTGYLRGSDFTAYRNTITHQHSIGGWMLQNVLQLTNTVTSQTKGYFFRPTVDLSKVLTQWGNYIIGFSYSLEHSENTLRRYDTLSPFSFSFDVVKAYVKSPEENPNKWSLTYYTRRDKIPGRKNFMETDRSQNINFTLELMKSEKHKLKSSITYRQLDANPAFSLFPSEKSMLSRTEYFVNEWKGFLTGNLLFETGAGQEQRRDFSFLEVPAGQGEYTWRDYNNDSIPQVNEFEIALFRDQAKFIRIFTPTRDYVKAVYTQLNYSVQLNPRILFSKQANGFQQFMGRINWQSSMQISKKQVAKDQLFIDPFNTALNDTSLITLNAGFANTLSYNRYSTVWGVDFSNITNENKALLTYGLESRKLSDWSMRFRYNISSFVTLEMLGKLGSNSLSTPSFKTRNYKIEGFGFEPRVTYVQSSGFRVQLAYKFDQKANQAVFGGEQAVVQSLVAETKYNVLNKSNLLGKFTYSNIRYTKTIGGIIDYNTPVAFILLNGLLPGSNYLWNIEFTKRLSNALELRFEYEGRQPAEGNTIHIGRASLRAIF